MHYTQKYHAKVMQIQQSDGENKTVHSHVTYVVLHHEHVCTTCTQKLTLNEIQHLKPLPSSQTIKKPHNFYNKSSLRLYSKSGAPYSQCMLYTSTSICVRRKTTRVCSNSLPTQSRRNTERSVWSFHWDTERRVSSHWRLSKWQQNIHATHDSVHIQKKRDLTKEGTWSARSDIDF